MWALIRWRRLGKIEKLQTFLKLRPKETVFECKGEIFKEEIKGWWGFKEEDDSTGTASK